MASMAIEQEYTASRADVWKVLREFGGLDWMPGVESWTVEGEGVGAIRHITMGGNVVTERLEAFDDDACSLSYSIQKGPIPVLDYLATISVHEREGGSRVEWSARFETPEGVPADALSKGLEGAYGGALRALKKRLEG